MASLLLFWTCPFTQERQPRALEELPLDTNRTPPQDENNAHRHKYNAYGHKYDPPVDTNTTPMDITRTPMGIIIVSRGSYLEHLAACLEIKVKSHPPKKRILLKNYVFSPEDPFKLYY